MDWHAFLQICMQKKDAVLFPFFPVLRKEEEEYGVDFETSYKHVETHEPLAGGRYHAEVAGRTGDAGARTYVAEHADAAAQSAVNVGTHEREGYHADDHEHEIDEDEAQGAAHPFVGYYLSAYLHSQHGAGMQLQDEFVEDALGTDEDADYLDSSGSASGTGSDGHDDNGGHPIGSAPGHIVEFLGRESGAGDDAGDVEECGSESLLYAFGKGVDGAGRNGCKEEEEDEEGDGHGYDEEIGAYLFVLEEYSCAPDAGIVVEAEVDTAHQHEDGADIFQITGLEIGDALGVGAESASGNGAHGMTDGIEEVHGTGPVEEHADGGEEEVDEQQAAGSASDFRSELVETQSGDFGREDVAVLHLIDGDEGKGEDNDAKTSHPLRDASPELESVHHSVNVADAGGSGGGEAAHGLEEGACHVHFL